MKGWLFAVILAVTLVISCAIEMSYGFKPGMWRQLKAELDHRFERHARYRRQTLENCTAAYEEYLSDYFQNCLDIFDEVSDDDLTNQELDVYCGNRCTSEILRVSRDLAVYCDSGGAPPDEHEVAILRLMCARNVYDDYCYVALENVINDKSAPDFEDCNPEAVPCSNVCKEVVHYIDSKLGCCFASFQDNGLLHSNYTIGFFTECGAVYIQAC